MLKPENDGAKPHLTRSMSTYSEAVEEFSRSATEFLKSVPLLTKSRDAFQRAMTVSAEVRSILDEGDNSLRNLMTQLEQAVSLHLPESAVEFRKKPEPTKVEPIRVGAIETTPRALP